MINQKDVAKLAKVSTATVSAVINKNKFVSEELSKRINEAINILGYTPNLVARSLKMKQTKSIGMILVDIENPFFIKMFKRIEELANEKGYNTILCVTENDPVREKKYINVLKGKLVDNYIIIPSSLNLKAAYDIAKDDSIVFIDRFPPDFNKTSIVVNNYQSVYDAMDYLTSLGHKKIGFFAIPQDATTGFERLKGYKEYLLKNDLNFDEKLIKYVDYSIEDAYLKTEELLNSKNKPTVLFSSGIMTSIGILKYLIKNNIKVPEDISFIAFDELYDFSELLDFKPTFIKQPVYKISELAVKLILSKFIRKNNKKITLKTEFVIGNSVKKL